MMDDVQKVSNCKHIYSQTKFEPVANILLIIILVWILLFETHFYIVIKMILSGRGYIVGPKNIKIEAPQMV
jgi:hypothetical protein